MTDYHRTIEKYVRLFCSECYEMFGNGEKFLTQEQYNQQMSVDKPWRCPDCKCYPCDFDDDYWELPLES